MNSPEKPVALITGSSSGIGRACVSRMFASGWRVLAGVRKQEDAEKLKRDMGTNLVPLILDVENRNSIAAAENQLQSALDGGGRPIYRSDKRVL